MQFSSAACMKSCSCMEFSYVQQLGAVRAHLATANRCLRWLRASHWILAPVCGSWKCACVALNPFGQTVCVDCQCSGNCRYLHKVNPLGSQTRLTAARMHRRTCVESVLGHARKLVV